MTACSAPAADAAGQNTELGKALESERQICPRAQAMIDILNQQIAALRRQLSALEEALQASEKEQQGFADKLADLGQRLNVALAQRIQELSRYRSEFFGRLRANPRQPARHPHRRRPLRVPVGGVLRHRSRRAAAGGAQRTRPGRRRVGRARPPDPGRSSRGCCASTAIPTSRRSGSPQFPSTGNCRRRARSPWCNTCSPRGCRRSGWSPRDSANFSRSIRPRRTRPRRNRRIELKLTER